MPPTLIDQARHLDMGSDVVQAPLQAILPSTVAGENNIIYLFYVIDVCII
jgi:hypothetical protein